MSGYTLAQVRVFLKAIAELERERRREALLCMRAAQADEQGFSRIWRAL